MMIVPSRWLAVCIAITAGACSAGDNTVDPSDLELRDLLGLSPDVASAWTAAQRAAARRVLVAGLHEDDTPSQRALEPDAAAAEPGTVGPGPTAIDERVARWLATDDARRIADGAGPLGVVRVAIGAHDLALTVRAAPTAAAAVAGDTQSRAAAPPVELWLAEQWDTERGWGHLAGRGLAVLSALAVDAEHPGGPVIVVPAPRLAVIAAYVRPHDDAVQPRLAVNPVLLAALEPDPDELATTAALQRWSISGPAARAPVPPQAGSPATASTGGNPYSFYGSFEECALAQRTRCEACLASSTCTPITSASDGNAECTMLAASSGRGYFLLCINLSLAITSVDRCTGDASPACARDPHAADALTTLENNADFLDDSTCAGALDTCLAKIYGAPDEPFPGLDGGTPPAGPPRSTAVSCGNACETKNTSCNASPSFDCTGPSCNNSLSCDSACASSNDQSGCGGNCNSCSSSSSGGSGCGGGSSGGGCGGSGSSGCGGGSGGSCGGDSCGSSSGCGSCGSGSGSSTGGSCGSGSSGCGGGGCGSGSGGSCGGSGGSCGGGGGGGGKCSAASSDPGPGVALAMSVIWGLLPVPFAALTRRRARRRRSARIAAGPNPDSGVDPDRDLDGGAPAEDAP